MMRLLDICTHTQFSDKLIKLIMIYIFKLVKMKLVNIIFLFMQMRSVILFIIKILY